LFPIEIYDEDIKLGREAFRKLYVTKSEFLNDLDILHCVNYIHKFLHPSSCFYVVAYQFNHKELSIAAAAAF